MGVLGALPTYVAMRLSVAALLLLTHVAAAAPHKIEITAAEARQHKLSHRIFIDVSDTAFSETRFSLPDVYLTLSGPPGGPLGIEILEQSRRFLDGEPLRKYVMNNYEVTEVSKTVEVTLGGRTWHAVAFIKGTSLARSINVYMVSTKGVAVHLDHSAGNKKLADVSVAGVLAMKPFDTVLPTLAID